VEVLICPVPGKGFREFIRSLQINQRGCPLFS